MICEECGVDHANIDIVQAFLNTVRFPHPQAGEMGAQLLMGFITWLAQQQLAISVAHPERVN